MSIYKSLPCQKKYSKYWICLLTPRKMRKASMDVKILLKNLIMKSYFIRKNKNTHTAVNENRKTWKSWTLFYNRFFHEGIESNNHFFFNRPLCSQDIYFICKLVRSAIFTFWYQNEAKNNKKGNLKRKLLEMANYNIHFKNNFSLSVINVSQINFLYWQNVHIWHLIKVNKRIL